MGKQRAPYSFFGLIVLFVLIIFGALLYPKWLMEGTEATISWDVFGYYLYLPSIFIYNDLAHLSFVEDVLNTYLAAGPGFSTLLDNANHVLKYSAGLSILYSPFFLLGHLFAGTFGYVQDGYSYPYQLFIAIGGFCYTLLGLVMARKVLLRYFSDQTTLITLILIVLGTNYYNYVAYDGAMTHNYLFTLYFIIIWFTISWHERQTYFSAIALGFFCGLAALCRPTEIVALIIPLGWGIYNASSFKNKLLLIKNNWLQVLGSAFLFCSVGLIQLVYWKVYSGNWIYYSYGDQGFSFLNPHLIDGLISYRKGWLLYTPNMLFAIGGFYFIFRKYRRLFFPLFAFFLINLYVVFSWDIWWYGGSFGARAMIQSYAVMAIPLAAFISWLLQSKSFVKVGISVLMICFTLLNLFQTYQAHSGVLQSEGQTRAYYWKTFGQTKLNPVWRKWLDVGFDLDNEDDYDQHKILFVDYESVGNLAHTIFVPDPDKPNNTVLLRSTSDQYGPMQSIPWEHNMACKNCWVRIETDYFFKEIAWDQWSQARLTLLFKEASGKKVFSRSIRLQWLAHPNAWHHIGFEYPVSYIKGKPVEVLAFIENYEGGRPIYIDNLAVSTLEPCK